MPDHRDEVYMARAMQLARRGLYTTDPNPRVGCVLVKDDSIIAEGWHVRAGGKHAEIAALNNAPNPAGATAYVTLEPCSHHGKTPPCCDSLIAAGVVRVVVAMQDPNPLVAGKGLSRLSNAGVLVDYGVLEADAKALNPGFIKRMIYGRPFVRSKLAMSLDGRTAMASGESKWITSAAARLDVHKLRASSSAVLTGIDTVLADDALLNARLENTEIVQPQRVVLDSTLKMPVTARIACPPGRSLILTCSTDEKRTDELRQAGFEVYRLAEKDARLDLQEVMAFLGRKQINEVLVESGALLNGALLNEGLVDEWLIYMAPIIMGDAARGLFKLPGVVKMADKKSFKFKQCRSIGPDLRLTLEPNKQV